jgi:transposase
MTIATLRPENKSHKWKYVIKLNILFHRALLFNKDSQVAFHVMTLDIFNVHGSVHRINPLKPELNPICYLLALLGAHHFSTLAG